MSSQQRPIPEAAQRDPDAVEILRLWIAEHGVHCSMKVGTAQEAFNVPESAAWGRILAELARYVASAMQAGYGSSPAETLKAIQASFEKEMEQPAPGLEAGAPKH